MIATAALLAFTALRMARHRAQTPGAEALEPGNGAPATGAGAGDERRAVFVVVGAVAGLLSGLLGIGGGVVMVPGFSEWVGMPVKEAIATSLACVAIFAIPSTITHARLHDIDWRFALLLTAGVVPGARLGAAAALKATDRRMRTAVAGFLGLISLLYAAGEIAALFH
jgi:uncharacterized membrane protein YfcA